MLANLLPSDPDQRRLARRFAVVLGTLFLALLAAVLATADDWPGAIAKAEKAGKKVKLEHLVKVWVWRGLVMDLVLAAVLALTVRWWVGSVKTAQLIAPASRRFWIIIGLLLVAAACYRAPRLPLSFYNDEAHNFVRMTSGELKHESPGSDAFKWDAATWTETLWFNGPGNNSQPHSLLSRLSYQTWKAMAGGADGEVCEWATRLPTFFAGLASLLVLALAMREMSGSIAAGATLMAGSVHAWHVRYSTEARGYGLMGLGIALMIFSLQRALKHGRWRDWLGYGLGNFLALWAFPGCLYWVAAVNGLLVLHLVWQWKTQGQSLEPLVRLVISGVLTLMLALPLMLPLFPQLLDALKNVPGLRGTMTLAWWQDIGSHLLFGARWVNADLANPGSLAVSRFLAEDPKWWLTVINGFVIAAIGFGSCLSKGGVSRLLVLAGVLAVLLGWADMARQGRYLNHWYVFYSVPAVLCCIGQGVATLLSQVRLHGWQRLFGALLLGSVAVRMTLALTLESLDRSKGEERAGVVQVRGSVYPHFMGDEQARKPLLAAIWSNAPIYDPLCVVIKEAATLEALKQRATAEQRPLFVIMGHRHSAHAEQPAVVDQLEGPAFEKIATFPGLDEEQYTQALFKLK
jgi:hypothetical protein